MQSAGRLAALHRIGGTVSELEHVQISEDKPENRPHVKGQRPSIPQTGRERDQIASVGLENGWRWLQIGLICHRNS